MWSFNLYKEFEKNIKKHQRDTIKKYADKYPSVPEEIVRLFIRKCAGRMYTPLAWEDSERSVKEVLRALELGKVTGREDTGYTEGFFLVLRYGDDEAVKAFVEKSRPEMSEKLKDPDLMNQLRSFLEELIDGEVVSILNEYLYRLEKLSAAKKSEASLAEVRKESPSVDDPDEGHKKPRLG